MVNKEYIYAMLGAPFLQLEFDDTQWEVIIARIKRVLDSYRKRGVPDECLELMEEEGVLAHVKYAIGRCRSKYERLPGLEKDMTIDGRELVAEAFEHIKWWYAMLENYVTVQKKSA